MEDVKRILVVSRMEKDSLKALHYGIAMARNLGAELFVMHAVFNPFGLEGWSLPVPNVAEEYKKLLENTKQQLHDMIASEKKNGMKINEIVVNGEPTKEILKTARENNIDLIVLAGHSEGRLEHMLFGGSTEDLVRKLPCSIFLVKKEPEPVAF
ncbi:MAG: universal stress protein [Nitrospiraceae bacterium]|nr:universal stress protein [Nitrospiraceae bacterium]